MCVTELSVTADDSNGVASDHYSDITAIPTYDGGFTSVQKAGGRKPAESVDIGLHELVASDLYYGGLHIWPF